MFCLESVDDGRRVFQTKPDILIKQGSRCVHIIDTKWKRISPRVDDPKQGISQADVYQMMAYGQIYQCPKLTLLYPHHNALGLKPGWQSMHLVQSGNSQLMTASVDLAEIKTMKASLRTLISDQAIVVTSPEPQ